MVDIKCERHFYMQRKWNHAWNSFVKLKEKIASIENSIDQYIAIGLKIGMHNPYMDGSKVTVKIFDILPRRWDI